MEKNERGMVREDLPEASNLPHFIRDAMVMIPELSGLSMTVCGPKAHDAAAEFERRFCFMPTQQPLYTAAGLLDLFAKKGPDRIYLASDALQTRCVCILIEPTWIVLGPYVTTAWKDGEARRRLSAVGAKENAFLPFKNYYCSLPVVGDERAVSAATMLLVHTVGNPPREIEHLDTEIRRLENMKPEISETYEELSVVERRYQLEDQLMDAVRQGRTAQALRVYSDLCRWSKGLKFMSDSLGDQIAGASMIRTLIRHAALQAGLVPVLVDALSQEYAQKMHAVTDSGRLTELIRQYIAAFCAAVRENHRKGQSPQVRRAIQYMEVHLSDPVTVDELCAAAGVSRQRFVRLFKEETGFTIKHYIARARCEQAAELLADSRLRIRDIAGYVGYEDTNYFARVFGSVMHMSPQEYREKNQFR